MCGRFNLIASPVELAELFSLTITNAPPPRYNIAPTQPVIALHVPAGGKSSRLGIFHWGLIPFWARDPNIGGRMINARGETAGEKPTFSAAMKYRRCLIPATGFFEWRQTADRKQPLHIKRRDGKPFAFAGLWEHWQSKDGSELESCAIITAAASPFMRKIHHRMPVIVQPADFGLWLDPTVQKADAVRHLLGRFPDAEMEATPIGTLVNNPRHDAPEILAPPAAKAQTSLFEGNANND